MKRLMNFISGSLESLEDVFLKYLFVICMIISVVSTLIYSYDYIKNIRLTMPNIIMFSSIIFVVISFILTLLISLKESLLFDRIKNNFPLVTKKIYKFINKIILSSIFVVMLALVVTILPSNLNKYLKYIISFIGFTMFWYMILGAIYMLKFTTDMVVKDNNLKKTEKIQ